MTYQELEDKQKVFIDRYLTTLNPTQSAIDAKYDRNNAVEYAKRWALSRNPRYYDFHGIGGDCTNFASQCIYAGAGVMNYTRY